MGRVAAALHLDAAHRISSLEHGRGDFGDHVASAHHEDRLSGQRQAAQAEDGVHLTWQLVLLGDGHNALAQLGMHEADEACLQQRRGMGDRC